MQPTAWHVSFLRVRDELIHVNASTGDELDSAWIGMMMPGM